MERNGTENDKDEKGRNIFLQFSIMDRTVVQTK